MRNKRVSILLMGLVAFVAASALTLLAVSELNVFELDGNAAESGNPGEDWQTVNGALYTPDGIGGHAFARTGAVPDMHPGVPPDATAFFNRQTKDIVDIPNNWTWKATSVPDKDDINNAYAAAYLAPNGDTIITFGADRYSAGNGDAFLGFWFFQGNVAPVAGGKFSGQHTPGDVLVLVNFEGGGSTPFVQVLKWAPGAGDVATDLDLIYSNNNALCGADTGNPACAITNADPVTVYWPFDYKGGATCDETGCTAPTLAFFEGAVNLTQVFGGGPLPCITNFLAETRSSSSVTADLKDFVAHRFELCGIGISKACGTAVAHGSSVTYTNSITVGNTGMGVLYDAVVTDVADTGVGTTATKNWAADCTGIANCSTVPALASLAPKGMPGSTVVIEDVYESTLLSASDTATVKAAPYDGGSQTIVPAEDATATCSVVVTPAVDVTKSCVGAGAELVEVGDVLAVKVTVEGTITNSGTQTDVVVSGISDNPSVTSIPVYKGGAPVSLPVKLAVGEALTYGPFSYFPKGSVSPACDSGTFCFSDVITVTWAAVLGGEKGTDTGQATCSLCKPGCLTGQSCQPITVSRVFAPR